eukprot:scaffold48878_cov58-Phaeocystis_antarctica.AAC.1
MRIPRRARSCRVRRSLHPCALLAVRHGVALKPPTPRHLWYEHEAHAESGRATRTARGCRPRPRRSHAGHGTTGSICYVPPHGAPGRVHQTPPAPLGARLSARREARGLRTTARPVAPTRARGALVSVSLARLGHEKVSSNVQHVRGRSRKSRSLESVGPFRNSEFYRLFRSLPLGAFFLH